MNEREMVDELVEYFATPSGYGPKLLSELSRTCANIPEEDRAHVCEIIREDNAPNFKVGIKAIADACKKLGVPFHKESDYYVPAIDWTCDACGLNFRYAQIVSYEDKHDKGIFDSCPRCGFPPYDTIHAQDIANRQRGNLPPRYATIKAEYIGRLHAREAEERNKPSGIKRYRGWIFDKQEDDDYMAIKRREEIEAMKRDARDEISKVAAHASDTKGRLQE